jgi:hypothetical protein
MAASKLRQLVRTNRILLPIRYAYHIFNLLRQKDQRKYTLEWLKSFREGYLFNKPAPFINFQAAAWLNNYLKNKSNLKVFEFGSGGSTLYWLSFKAQVVSIEHDEGWYEKIKRCFSSTDKIDYRLVKAESSASDSDRVNGDPADPDLSISGLDQYKGCSFSNYVSQINDFPDQYFDLIMVDGRARPACLVQSLAKVKAGGIIVLDNSDRPHYTKLTGRYLNAANFDLKQFSGYTPSTFIIETTSIYQKL